MADIFGDIGKIVGDAIPANPISPAADVLHGVSSTILDANSVSGIADGMQQLGEQLHLDIQPLSGIAAGHVIDAVSDTSTMSPEQIHDAAQLMDTLKATLEQAHEADMHVIQNLHANADDASDAQGTLVASTDGHAAVHVDDHAGATPTHDDATPDPSTTA